MEVVAQDLEAECSGPRPHPDEVVAGWEPGVVETIELLQRGPEPPSHAVADHGGTDLPVDGEGDATEIAARVGATLHLEVRPSCTTSLTTKDTERAPASESDDQAERRCRPFSRRARITARPPLVAIRWRNPCFLARLRTFGWKVRFIGSLPGMTGTRPSKQAMIDRRGLGAGTRPGATAQRSNARGMCPRPQHGCPTRVDDPALEDFHSSRGHAVHLLLGSPFRPTPRGERWVCPQFFPQSVDTAFGTEGR